MSHNSPKLQFLSAPKSNDSIIALISHQGLAHTNQEHLTSHSISIICLKIHLQSIV